MKLITIGRALAGSSAILIVAVGLSACSSSGSGTASATTLRMAFSGDPAPLDPDTYYEAEGLQITTAVYQGLVTYSPNSPQIEPALATSWNISSDGLSYTFKLKPNGKFSDGTPVDATAIKESFERRIALNGGPSYMLADIETMAATDANTFVVTLKRPVAPFLDFLASPYGPVAISPTAVKAHAKGSDKGAGWLGAHSAGTGPYVLSDVVKATRYVLKPNPYFSGAKPAFSAVNIAVVPDFATQSLQLKSGQLDVVSHGLGSRDYSSMSADSKLQVQNFPTFFKAQIWVNPSSSTLGDSDSRKALKMSIDAAALTKKVYGDRATPSTQFYPNDMLPEGDVPDTWTPDSSAIPKAMASKKGAKVIVGYYGDDSLRELANSIQVQLQDAGLSATVRSYDPAQVFALPTEPKQRPDLLIAAMNPDAAHVDTWMSVYQGAEAPVNFLGCSVPRADALASSARATVDKAESTRMYAEAGRLYRDSNCWIDVADVNDTIAASANLTGWSHQLPWVFTVGLNTLAPKAGN